jgi:hypothetical protein
VERNSKLCKFYLGCAIRVVPLHNERTEEHSDIAVHEKLHDASRIKFDDTDSQDLQ